MSNMKSFTWKKGIQISLQIDKLENWLKETEQFDLYNSDGFLRDFSKLVSTRSVILKKMNWESLKKNNQKIPPSILMQFLSTFEVDDSTSLLEWFPPQNEMYISSQDVRKVLSEYLQSANDFSIFNPEIIRQLNPIPMDKMIESIEFISLCTVMDSELIAMASTFRWMALPKPPSLRNFNDKEKNTYKRLFSSSETSIIKKGLQTQQFIHQQDSCKLSPLSEEEKFKKKENLIEKYRLLKLNMDANSSSLLNDLNNFKYQMNKNPTPSVKKLKYQRNNSVKSSLSQSEPSISNFSYIFPCAKSVDLDAEFSLNDNLRHVDYRIEGSLKDWKSQIDNQLKSEHSTSNSLINIQKLNQIDVTLKKSKDKSYGITIADGMEISLGLKGIFICQITKNSPADINGKLSPGDEILFINNYSVKDLYFKECLLLMKKSETIMRLLIEKATLERTLKINTLY